MVRDVWGGRGEGAAEWATVRERERERSGANGEPPAAAKISTLRGLPPAASATKTTLKFKKEASMEDQSAVLESFKEHITLNPKQKMVLAKNGVVSEEKESELTVDVWNFIFFQIFNIQNHVVLIQVFFFWLPEKFGNLNMSSIVKN